jgi:S-adenosylmethionine:tRNA ribosyltransferase-isomerase
VCLDAFDYDLPPHLIAQQPAAERDLARLMVVSRAAGTISHHIVRDLPDLLEPGDGLVVNNTRVLPARLLGRRERTGGKWEGLFLRQSEGGSWELLCQTRGRLLEGEWVAVEPGPLRLRLVSKTASGHWLAEPEPCGPPEELLARHGHVPLPPYIRKGRDEPADRDRYQTVFAREPGAVAAPTAGLHLTPALLERLDRRGVRRVEVTLHVGVGTFQPIQVQDITRHRMHAEWGSLSPEAAATLQQVKDRGGRIVAVGTTSVRVLETAAASGALRPWSGETQLYIHPPYQFRAVNALMTNFHLPRSSLLLLVSAFTGTELIRRAYRMAIEQGYRFYSYGDAMLIL